LLGVLMANGDREDPPSLPIKSDWGRRTRKPPPPVRRRSAASAWRKKCWRRLKQ
jgi:hypothetical protein